MKNLIRITIINLSFILISIFNTVHTYGATINVGIANFNITPTSAGGTAFATTDNLTVPDFNAYTYNLTSNVQCVNFTLGSSHTLNLNGFTLTVTGTLTVNANNNTKIDLGNGGQLLVTGNATIGSGTGITGSGASNFTVGGALTMSSFNNTYITLGASGSLKVAGNLNVGSSNTVTVGTLEMNGCPQTIAVNSNISLTTFKQSSTCSTTIGASGSGTITVTTTYDQNNNPINIKPTTNFTVSGSTINAGPKTWSGLGTNNNMTQGANWVGGVAPVSGDAIIFAGSTRLTPNNNFAGVTFASITFASGAGDFTIAGNALTISGGSSAITASNTSGTMTMSLNIAFSNATPTITCASGGILTLSGVLSGTAAITKSGVGSLFFTGSNTYSGGTTINAGYIRTESNTALGTGAISINAGTYLMIWAATAKTLANNFILNGSSGNSLYPTISHDGGAGLVTLNGTITLNANSEIGLGGFSFNNIVINGIISGTGALSIDEYNPSAWNFTQTATLNGANTYAGATTISSGTLILGASGVIPNTSALTVTGTLDMNNFSEEVGSIAGAGIIDNIAGAGTPVLTCGGNLSTTTFSGVIKNTSGTLRLVKKGTGTLTLSGVNTFSGNVTIDEGKLIAGNNSALGNTTGTTSLTALASPYTELELANGVTITGETLAMNTLITGDLRSILSANGTSATWNGTISLAGSNIAMIYSNAATVFNVQGNINGSCTLLHLRGTGTGIMNTAISMGATHLLKTETSTWTINSSGNIWGNTFVNLGTLKSGINSALPSTTVVTVGQNDALNATLDLNGFTQTIAGLQNVTYNAGGVKSVSNSGAATTLTINNSSNYSYAYIIANALNLIKTGTGTQTLSGANTYTGTTLISAGTIKLGANEVIPNTSAVTVTGTLDVNGFSETVGSIAGGGTIDNITGGGTPTLTCGGDNTSTIFSGTIQNTGGSISLTKTGSNSLIFTSNTITVNNLAISVGTLVAASSTINVFGNFTSSGTFTANTSNVNMIGSSSQAIPGVTFYNLTLNNAAGATLSGNSSVNNTLTLSAGILNTGVSTIDLGANGSIVEATPNTYAPTSYVTGIVKATRNTGSSSGTVNFGGLGLDITETTQTNNSTVVTRTTGTAKSFTLDATTYNGIKRFFDITPVIDVALNGTMVMHYFDHELNGSSEANLKIYKEISPNVWTKKTYSVASPGTNSISLSNITDFSLWTASDYLNQPLPILLVKFTAQKTNQGSTQLDWTTATEINNDFFTIEKSNDGERWKSFYTQNGAGNSNSIINYQTVDENPFIGFTYYRVKQTDYDGNFSYSYIQVVNSNKNKIESLYPNPSFNVITLELDEDELEDIQLYDLQGINLTVYLHLINSSEGKRILDLTKLTSGFYLIKTPSFTFKFEKLK